MLFKGAKFMNYFPIIGLEVHVELETKSKMFCSCDANYFGKEPNTHCCPVCLGLPGALPVPNKKAIQWCRLIGLALNCEITKFSKFDRKNYFYPDLPKGYQISQYDLPFCRNGSINVNGQKIGIERVHMEEDTAKLLHAEAEGEKVTLIDFNRSGVPLVEIVTKPDIHSSEEAKAYLEKLQKIIRGLKVSSCDMEKGSMRLEPNISLMNHESRSMNHGENKLPNYKVEIKNINSFRFVKKAIDFEIERQKELLEKGEKISQETRGWDERKNITTLQRSKEEAKDYRYFPEPDIPPFKITEEKINQLKEQMPRSLDEVTAKFEKDYGLSSHYVHLATISAASTDYFENAVALGKKVKISPKEIADWLFNRKIDQNKVAPAELIAQIKNSRQKKTIEENEIKKMVEQTIKEDPDLVQTYKSGKSGIINVLIGKVMAKAKGQADANLVRKLMTDFLKNNG